MSDSLEVDGLAHDILMAFTAGAIDVDEVAQAFDRAEALRPGLIGAMLFVGAIRHGADALRRLAVATGQSLDDLLEQREYDLDFQHITFEPDDD